jgi:uncharacterized protein (DUF427 family)
MVDGRENVKKRENARRGMDAVVSPGLHRPGAPDPAHRAALEPCPKWIRGEIGGEVVVDSKHASILFETGHVPTYYFPEREVRMDRLEPSDRTTRCPVKGKTRYWSLDGGGERTVEDAAWACPEPIQEGLELRGLVAFDWNALDAWYEEGEQVFVHARDPYKRVDVLTSSRQVRVEVEGITLAETTRPVLLFETGLPVRYYLPRLDVRMDLLEESDHRTECPYKGVAEDYWTVRLKESRLENVAWCYRAPTSECTPIAGRVAFYNEKVDLIVDGERLTRPTTIWS